jgi:hypothetical protein
VQRNVVKALQHTGKAHNRSTKHGVTQKDACCCLQQYVLVQSDTWLSLVKQPDSVLRVYLLLATITPGHSALQLVHAATFAAAAAAAGVALCHLVICEDDNDVGLAAG